MARESVARFFEEAERALGPVDVLVDNAGITAIGPLLDERDEVTRAPAMDRIATQPDEPQRRAPEARVEEDARKAA